MSTVQETLTVGRICCRNCVEAAGIAGTALKYTKNQHYNLEKGNFLLCKAGEVVGDFDPVVVGCGWVGGASFIAQFLLPETIRQYIRSR